ncbi:beta-lactamase superfamily domain-containing protein [Chytriomyces sp. MP71]|nr:beta-lactamase superfamily domain-containing protein [Chytriomyces sp. MP71]
MATKQIEWLARLGRVVSRLSAFPPLSPPFPTAQSRASDGGPAPNTASFSSSILGRRNAVLAVAAIGATVSLAAWIATGNSVDDSLSPLPLPLSASASSASLTVGNFVLRRTLVPPHPDFPVSTAHHNRDGSFHNPWPSFAPSKTSFVSTFAKFILLGSNNPALPHPKDRLRVRPLNKDRINAIRAQAFPIMPSKNDQSSVRVTPDDAQDAMRLDWLGHAAMLLTVPGATVLFDPCLSDRCSPINWAGPRRIVPTPLERGLDDLPDVDVVVVSHNHYDHLDVDVMKKIATHKPEVLFFVPLGNKRLLLDAGIRNVVECDWWDSFTLTRNTITDSASNDHHHHHKHDLHNHPVPDITVQITCTPAQHFSSRHLLDKNATLWSSWHLRTRTKSFFFGGDTGYRTVPDDATDAADALDPKLPTCPSFREVRARLGPVDLAALPIGAYAPRALLSNVHCSPRDAVDVHLDLGAARSVAMHFGTFVLSREEVSEPVRLLREAMRARGVEESVFLVVDVGQGVEV